MNMMQDIVLDKVVVNMGTGSEKSNQENAKKLLTTITGRKPADSISKRRLPTFKITKGTKIGVFVTVRGKPAYELSERLFKTVDNTIGRRAISGNTVNFGIKEYIDIPGIKYDPTIGILGMNVNVSFRRAGARVSARKRMRSGIRMRHMLITREGLSKHLEERFGVKMEGVE